MSQEDLNGKIVDLGTELWGDIQKEAPGLFDSSFWHGQMLDWVMKDPSFKTDMFRFVDVFPVLNGTDDIARHIREYLLKDGRELPRLMQVSLNAASKGLTAGLAEKLIRKQVSDMAERFIVGHDAQSAIRTLRILYDRGVTFTADLLGEAVFSEQEALQYRERYLDLVDNLSAEVWTWESNPLLNSNHVCGIPATNISLKVSAFQPFLDVVDCDGSVDLLYENIMPVLLRARERNVFVNFDMEQWSLHEITMRLFEKVCQSPEFHDWPHLGIVIQAYLNGAHDDYDRLLFLAARRGCPITVRLVKGAYWDYETVHARQHGLPCPVIQGKSATDFQYEQLVERLFGRCDLLWPAFGTHNLRSICHAITYAESKGIAKNTYEFQMLYGMAEAEREVLKRGEYRLRLYAPVGDMIPGMAYLVRRLLENSSNQGFLKLSFHDHADIKLMLAPPRDNREEPEAPNVPFRNASFLDFNDTIRRGRFAAAVESCSHSLPRAVPVVVDGKDAVRNDTKRECPSDMSICVADVTLGNEAELSSAVSSARAAWPEWRDRPISERAEILHRAAELLERDRFDMAALQCFEVGKTWREADADVAEAIDFCNYYAQRAPFELGERVEDDYAGEENVTWAEGRGVTAVIAPWNFPTAILCGMTAAALVAGNAVIMKPAEQSSACAYELFRRLIEAGVPDNVLHFLPGAGDVIGAGLVRHPDVVNIAFTGSREVGLSILKSAAEVHPGQEQVKRVICEMGGKNAIIVDEDADIDEAVSGVIASAFGFAGQKCSACSRLILVGNVYHSFKERLLSACASIRCGKAHEPSCMLGPVVDETSFSKLTLLLNDDHDGAELLYRGGAADGGYFIAPAVYELSDPEHPLMTEEFFGPVLAIIRAAGFDEALEIANDSDYALTGAVYSRLPSHIEKASRGFRVGNLYINRKSTGAFVWRQPFGGFKMSGTGHKAGGPGYLLEFSDQRCRTENTMRRGFTPEE